MTLAEAAKSCQELVECEYKKNIPDTANAKKQDSDVVNCVNAVVDAQISIKGIFPRAGLSVDFEHMFFIFFGKYIIDVLYDYF